MNRSPIAPGGGMPAPGQVALRRLPYVAAGWLLFGLAQWILVRIAMRSVETSLAELGLRLSIACCWVLITYGVWAWVGLLDRSRRTILTLGVAHLAGILVVALIDTSWRRTSQMLFYGRAGMSFPSTFLYFLDLTTVSYCAIVILKRVADAQDAVVSQNRRQLTLRTQLAQAQLDYLEMQLQPHFLFNSLGAVIELAYDAPAAASRMLRQLAAVLRFAVQGRAQTVTLGEELAALEPYLDIQRVRFADWLTIARYVTPDAARVKVPRLTLQPLVENAIRHGLAGRRERGHIDIRASVSGGFLTLEVSDNGVGLGSFRGTAASGLGLRNLRTRLWTLYGENASVTLRKSHGRGATTEVRLLADPGPLSAERAEDPDEGICLPESRLPALFTRNAIVVGWIAWGLLWIQLNVVWLWVGHQLDRPFLPMIWDYLVGVLIWAALTPLMLVAARRNSVLASRAWGRVALHGAFALGFALVHVALWQSITRPRTQLWSSTYVETMLWTVTLYVMFVGLTSYREMSRWFRERETSTARIRADIAEAQLTAAALRFDPESVLARLDQAADLMWRDPVGAEVALTGLAAQLRETLDTARRMPRTLVTFAAPLVSH